jgi:hypothetical protein
MDHAPSELFSAATDLPISSTLKRVLIQMPARIRNDQWLKGQFFSKWRELFAGSHSIQGQ